MVVTSNLRIAPFRNVFSTWKSGHCIQLFCSMSFSACTGRHWCREGNISKIKVKTTVSEEKKHHTNILTFLVMLFCVSPSISLFTNNIKLNVQFYKVVNNFLYQFCFSVVTVVTVNFFFFFYREGLNEMYNVIRKQLDSEIQLRKVRSLADWLQFLINTFVVADWGNSTLGMAQKILVSLCEECMIFLQKYWSSAVNCVCFW